MISGPPGGGGSAVVTGTFQGTAAARPAPAAAPAGAVYWATDTNEISVNNLGQTAWQAIATVTPVGHTFAAAGNSQINSSGGTSDFSAGNFKSSVIEAVTGFTTKEVANGKQGTAVLVAGTVTVSNTSTTATSRIFLTGNVLGGTAGGLNVSARTAGTSFTITSTNAADTSTAAYEMFEVGA